MLLEFESRVQYGRVDLYPYNEAARLILCFKRRCYPEKVQFKVKCVCLEDVELFKMLGHEVRIFTMTDPQKLKRPKAA